MGRASHSVGVVKHAVHAGVAIILTGCRLTG